MSSSYHSLQAEFERRLSAGLWTLVAYTYSKNFWRQATPAVGGNHGWEKALASFDVPHNFTASFGYDLPVGKGKRLLGAAGPVVNGVLGEWQLQGIMGMRSGQPYTPAVSRDVANIGVGGQRPHRIGSGELANPTLDVAFDKTAFAVPANFTYGNSGASILRRDKLGVFDFSLFKQFYIGETQRIQFRAEVFNLPNTAYFNAPGTNIDVASGGRITSTANTPRKMHFGLKYYF